MRKSNFELLRIIAMFMIVLHHLVNHGVMQYIKGESYSSLWLSGTAINQFFTWLYFPGGEIGIALFFMISGYFLILSDSIKLKKIIFSTFFYSLFTVFVFSFIFILVQFFNIDNPYSYIDSKKIFRKLIFNLISPLRSEQFWFVSAYVLLILVKPLYNNFLNKLNNKGYISFLVVLFIFGLMYAYCFNLLLGYTQAVFYYALGAYFRTTSCTNKTMTFFRGGMLLTAALAMWLLYAVIRYESQIIVLSGIFGEICKAFMYLIPTSVCVTITAIAIFKLFKNLNIGFSKLINTIASTTFGIYLLHEGYFTRTLLWDKIVGVYPNLYESPNFPIITPFVALAVFISCSLFELLREHSIRPLEEKIDILLNCFRGKFIKKDV